MMIYGTPVGIYIYKVYIEVRWEGRMYIYCSFFSWAFVFCVFSFGQEEEEVIFLSLKRNPFSASTPIHASLKNGVELNCPPPQGIYHGISLSPRELGAGITARGAVTKDPVRGEFECGFRASGLRGEVSSR
jgi:hypothetical protein